MHTQPMAEHEGEFSKPSETKYECPTCGKLAVTCRTWESSCGGYEDYKYTCNACGHYWWVDGLDA